MGSIKLISSSEMPAYRTRFLVNSNCSLTHNCRMLSSTSAFLVSSSAFLVSISIFCSMRSSSLDANSRALASAFCDDAFSTAVLKLLSSSTAGCCFVFFCVFFPKVSGLFFGHLQLRLHLQRRQCHYRRLRALNYSL